MHTNCYTGMEQALNTIIINKVLNKTAKTKAIADANPDIPPSSDNQPTITNPTITTRPPNAGSFIIMVPIPRKMPIINMIVKMITKKKQPPFLFSIFF